MALEGLKQADLARAIGVTSAQASRWLSGHNAINQPVAMAIELALGYRWQWLRRNGYRDRDGNLYKLRENERRWLTLGDTSGQP